MSDVINKPNFQSSGDSEPTEQRSSSPVWLFGLLAVLLYGGLLYMNSHAGGFSSQVYEPYGSVEELAAAQPKSAGDELAVQGKKIFAANCAVCHQATGLGAPGQFPPLAGSEWVNAKSPTRIIRIVLNGAQGPIVVEGKPFNNAMVPWKDVLTDDQIAAVLSYVRGNKEWGNTAPPVDPKLVKTIRDKTKDKTGAWNPADLEKLNEGE